ncbi:MAG: hypothetical protein DBX00_02565, partial [Verrucomicrobia bacterium]
MILECLKSRGGTKLSVVQFWPRGGLVIFGLLLAESAGAQSLPEVLLLPETRVTAERLIEGDEAAAFWSTDDI